jgi:hypothetical protein
MDSPEQAAQAPSNSEHPSYESDGMERSWAGDFDPFADPEERRVLFAAFDSFRYVALSWFCFHFSRSIYNGLLFSVSADQF